MKNTAYILLIIIPLGCKTYEYNFCRKTKSYKSSIIKDSIVKTENSKILIKGSVEDYKEEIIPFCKIIFTKLGNLGLKEEYIKVSKEDGEFKFELAEGRYKLTIFSVGYTNIDTIMNFKKYENRIFKFKLGVSSTYESILIKRKRKLSKKEFDEIMRGKS